MRPLKPALIAALLAGACAIAAGPAVSAPAPALSPLTGAPVGVDWSGVWQTQPPKPGTGTDWYPAEAPQTPAYKAKLDSLRASWAKGQAEFEPAAGCQPIGMPRFMNAVYGLEIWHRPGAVGIFAEYPGFLRHIHTDGRSHPPADELDPTYYGDSVGHWEGKDLLVDTVGIKGETLLTRDGVEISDSASVKERFHQVDADTLTDTITLTDPKALTRPWTITKTYKRSPKIDMMEFFCDNNRHPLNADGSVTTILNPERK